MPSLPFSSQSSSKNVPHMGHDDPIINGHQSFHFENYSNSNFGLNHINEGLGGGGGFVSSQPLTPGNNNFNNQTSIINTGLCQNSPDLISQMGQVGLGLGGDQLGVGMSQRVMMSASDQVRRANLVAPQSQTHRVHVHTVIDYFPVLQNRSLLGPDPEVTFTEIVRTKLLAATSTRERILQVSNNNINGASASASAFAWNNNNNNNNNNNDNNNIIQGQGQGRGCNNNLDLNHSYTERPPHNPVAVHGNIISHDHYLGHRPNPGVYDSCSHCQNNNLVREHGYNFHHNIFSHNQYPGPPVPPRSRAPLRLIEIDDENYTAESRSDIGALIRRDVKPKLSSCSSSSNVPVAVGHHHHHDHQIQDTTTSDDSSDDEDEDAHEEMMEVGDGRTHSLPYKKYGPYTCPRCMGVFNTSQLFAAHMGSHYKYETASERKRRKQAKYGKKPLRLVHSPDGLTLVPATTTHDQPQTINNNNRRRRRRKLANRVALLAVKAEPEDDHNEPAAPAPAPPTAADFEGLVEVKVKDEPLDMVFNVGMH